MSAALQLPPLPQLPKAARVWVAFSGGCDSTVLLQLLSQAGLGRRLRAVHVHHGLQAAAADWPAHCRRVCRRLGVPLSLESVTVDRRHPGGTEAAAREARYQALGALMAPGDCLVTAHHRDDQAETLLLRLLRGTGVAGMAGMQPLTAFGPGWLWRPLLDLPRHALREHAHRQGLEWVEDPHNRDPAYARSWLRREVMPRLQQRWPQAAESLARYSRHAAEAKGLLAELAQIDLQIADVAGGLSIRVLRELSAARRNNLLRHWLERAGRLPPPAALLERLERELLAARPDATPRLPHDGAELRRYRDVLYLLPALPPAPKGVDLAWPPRRRELALPAGCGRLQLPRAPTRPLIVRFSAGGEELRPVGSKHRRSLKNLFQEAGIPVWIRQRTPLVYAGKELLAVAGFWRAEKSPEFTWQHELPGVPAELCQPKH
ncbi:tRNA lysidine(34) synthetase TilS [Solimonas sp. K1W22B-7]|uniref:tRNA lysidine(34) synthetase TilS n=1 Tax=Solimonas sp. K1W22B-7 TaxID=2303331 RepID=UPI000E336AE4|nr:tRNA lysidine(34) synthetase TilS [Solimonas sp. K1W22B-7]AXQ28989.1 tRNA lysidine(34) synthetase TilS [Solimonas sp. K1W22B-7]